jgi:Lrp/AsnC family leucine-responsive transcriptional regulator
MDSDVLDDVNRALLAELAHDGRATVRALAAGVGMSEPAVRERLNGMRRAGVINGYRAVLDPSAVGRGTAAFVALRFAPASRAGVDAALQADPAVLEAHEIAGEDCYLVKVRLGSTADLADMLDRLRQVPGMTGTRSTVVLRTVFERGLTPRG